jgi:hypothetical protein
LSGFCIIYTLVERSNSIARIMPIRYTEGEPNHQWRAVGTTGNDPDLVDINETKPNITERYVLNLCNHALSFVDGYAATNVPRQDT